MILDQEEFPNVRDETFRKRVLEVLQRKHHHQNEKKKGTRFPIVRSFGEVGQKRSDHSMDKTGETSVICLLSSGYLLTAAVGNKRASNREPPTSFGGATIDHGFWFIFTP